MQRFAKPGWVLCNFTFNLVAFGSLQEMRLIFPSSHRINSGIYVMKELAATCRANDVTCHLTRTSKHSRRPYRFPHGPTLYFTLHNVTLRHDIAVTGNPPSPNGIFESFSSWLGKCLVNALQYLFPVAKEDAERVLTSSNEDDLISFRHHVFVKRSHKEIQLAEVGPRFEMKREHISMAWSSLTSDYRQE
ncbi:Brix-domain-containing protein [Ramaria rubella]|nr:Brix-domain-containing protein [Ramaria rubella]